MPPWNWPAWISTSAVEKPGSKLWISCRRAGRLFPFRPLPHKLAGPTFPCLPMSEPCLRFLPSIREADAAAWDALAGSHPALAHAYLATLENTGCVGPGTGWIPRHASLWWGDKLVAALPLYEKAHSYGEYVFDWAWAEAYARHGLDYYPKWLAAIPFSPLPGPRLLARDDAHRRRLLATVLAAARSAGVPSLHLLFPTEEEAALMAEAGLMLRQGVQFHWHNAGYRDFEDFLAHLNHDKRKKIRQERRRAREGLAFCWLDGHQASAEDWRFFYRCYALTYAAHRSTPYLTPAFFPALARAMPEAVRLLRVDRDGAPLAAASMAAAGARWTTCPACTSRSATTPPSTTPSPRASPEWRAAPRGSTSWPGDWPPPGPGPPTGCENPASPTRWRATWNGRPVGSRPGWTNWRSAAPSGRTSAASACETAAPRRPERKTPPP